MVTEMFKLHTMFSPFFYVILHNSATQIVTGQVCYQAYVAS